MARTVRRIFISDPHLSLAFVAAAIVVLWHFLHILKVTDEDVPVDGLLIVITYGIFALSLESSRESYKATKNAKKLDSIYQSFSGTRVALRSRPSKAEEYGYLWGGYTGLYCVYNPSYKVDRVSDEEEIVKIFIHRYQDPNFRQARYLFLTGDECGRDELKYFQKLMNRVKQEYPDVVKKITVKEIKEKEAFSEAEMYLGSRFGEERGVIELKEPVPRSQHGMPHYYLVIDDQEVIKHCRQEHFDLEWGNENAMVKDDFWNHDS